MYWRKTQKPTDKIDKRLFRVVKMLKYHVKYCPIDNQDEIHIINKSEFNKLFHQTTIEKYEH